MHKLPALTGAVALFLVFAFAGVAMSQVDVARRTTAITYPLDDQVFVQFRGTTRFPRMKGEAKVRRTGRNGSVIELLVSKMPRPFELGAGYATYVLWAISPDGQVDNLGEIKRRGFFEFDSKMNVTTPLQTFALIITAEPHFLVRRPSSAIMLENLSPYTTTGKVIATTPAVQYFGNSSDFFKDARTPEIAEVDYSKTPSTILQARQAVALARYAGADRDAAEELKEAETLLQNADESWKAGRDEETVDITARRAISTAVKAETTASVRKEAREKRNEKTRADADLRQAEDKFADAQAEIAELKARLSDETRSRELSERDVANYVTQIRDLREENGKLREEIGRTRTEADNARARVASLENEKQAGEQQRQRDSRIAAMAANEPAFLQSLRRFGSVSKNERGILLTIPDNYFTGQRAAEITAVSDPKVVALGQLLAQYPDYRVVIESHVDDRGAPEELQSLSDQRAQALRSRLASAGVEDARIDAKGLGGTLPVAPNTTVANRAKNRRINIILAPAI